MGHRRSGGGWEINAVSREVVFVLLLVVFESHPVTQVEDATVYIYMSIQRFGSIWIRGTVPHCAALDSNGSLARRRTVPAALVVSVPALSRLIGWSPGGRPASRSRRRCSRLRLRRPELARLSAITSSRTTKLKCWFSSACRFSRALLVRR